MVPNGLVGVLDVELVQVVSHLGDAALQAAVRPVGTFSYLGLNLRPYS